MVDLFKQQIMKAIADRDRAREMASVRAWDRLSEREKKLVKEAAVMGYVLGTWPTEEHKRELAAGRNVPRDASIVEAVMDGALSNPDLYPALCGEADEEVGAD